MKTIKLLIFLPIALLLVFPAHATQHSTATGTVSGNSGSTITERRIADNNTFVTATGMLSFSGGILGEGPTTTTGVIHNSTGIAQVKVDMEFSGTVMGSQPGTMEILLIGVFTGFGTPATTLEGHLVLNDGTEGLAGIHGEGTLVATSIESGITYSVNIHFDPT